MGSVQFTTIIGPDGVIRPPAGMELPAGTVEVTVRQGSFETSGDNSTPTHDWLIALAREVEQAAPNLPADMAERHDHYAHGKPKP